MSFLIVAVIEVNLNLERNVLDQRVLPNQYFRCKILSTAAVVRSKLILSNSPSFFNLVPTFFKIYYIKI